MKDILVLWDNSQSVGYKYFVEYVRPFLKNLITSEKLNVAKGGTHIGFITFATEDKTREILKLGEITDPDDLVNWLDKLNYDKQLRGDGTRTGLAMKIANNVSCADVYKIVVHSTFFGDKYTHNMGHYKALTLFVIAFINC
jgi:hypothetical protein